MALGLGLGLVKTVSGLVLAKAIDGSCVKASGQSGKSFKSWFRHAAISAKDEVLATQGTMTQRN